MGPPRARNLDRPFLRVVSNHQLYCLPPNSSRGYCLDGLSPLETVVPDELMPDELVVHDLFNLTRRHRYSPIKPAVRYRRAMPLTDGPTQLVRPATEPTESLSQHRVAHLYLPENRLGVGNHSTVFRAPFELRLDPTSGECARVTVAVKTAAADCVSHRMLHQEALMYTAFPRTFMEESSQGLSGAHADVGHGQSQCLNGKGRRRRGPKILPAVVPKFYGYYLPLGDDGNIMWSTHRECGEESKPCRVDWPSGRGMREADPPLSVLSSSRQQCFALFERLHKAGFSQGSPLERNILVQPGPLSEPRERRSLERPSFRLIDFGRGEAALVSRKADVDGPRFAKCVGSDKTHARRALRLHAYPY
ncbi:hypothetical protein LXA43DRAFT_986205 [Ganoderma leucocontextum]|nr:hypothetical protein LXA43DRAFT_986205 [Ganoderma leucocontextum]